MLLQWRQTIKRWGDRLRVRKCEEEEKMCGGSTHLEAGELCSLVFHRVLCTMYWFFMEKQKSNHQHPKIGSTHLEAGGLCTFVFHRVLCIYRTKDTIYNTQSTHDATVHTTQGTESIQLRPNFRPGSDKVVMKTLKTLIVSSVLLKQIHYFCITVKQYLVI